MLQVGETSWSPIWCRMFASVVYRRAKLPCLLHGRQYGAETLVPQKSSPQQTSQSGLGLQAQILWQQLLGFLVCEDNIVHGLPSMLEWRVVIVEIRWEENLRVPSEPLARREVRD